MNARTSSSDRRLDVVLTYARNTLALARAIHKFLKSAGLQVWFDEVSPRTGDHWLASHYRALTRARHHLILLTERTPPMWQKSVFDFASRCAALNRSLETVPLLREGFEPGPLAETLARYQVAHLAHDKDERDAQLRDLVARLREQSVRASVPPSDAVVPYSGLRAYEVDEAGVFFGRDLEVSEAVARLGTQPDGRHRRWLRIIGPSGVGKASFARAGLTSAVLRGGIQGAPLAWRMATVRLGDEPIEQLSVELATVFPGLGARDVANTLRTAGLADLVHDLLPADQGLLLVIDHLEDVHGHRVAPEVRTRIDRLLSEALEDFDQRLFLVTTERGDVSDDIDGRLPRLTGLLGSHGAVQTLAEPTREGLKAIIDGPAALRGRPWPPVLARQLLDDAERHRGGPGALSWMLATLMHADRATIQGYEGLGGLATGVGKAYDARLAAMSEDDQTRTRSLLTALVDGGRGRGDRPRALSFEEAVAAAGEGPRAEALVERLETGLGAEGGFAPPFLRIDGPQGARRVRLVHGALLRLWPTLRSFIDADRPVLERRAEAERAAATWNAGGRERKALPRGPRMAYLAGEDLPDVQRRRLIAALPMAMRRFIDAGQAEAAARREMEEAQREATHAAEVQRITADRDRTQTRANRFRTAVLVLCAAVLGLGGLAVHSQGRIDELSAQVRWGAEKRRAVTDQLRETEQRHLEAEQARVTAEAQKRQAEFDRRLADRERDTAQRDAEQLAEQILTLASTADTYFARIPGVDGKYARRLSAQAMVDGLREAAKATPDNLRMRLVLARLHLQIAAEAGERKERSTQGAHLSAAVETLEPMARGEGPAPPHLEALAQAQQRLGVFLTRNANGVPEAYADFEKGEAALLAAIETWGRLAEAQPEQSAARRNSQAGARARLARYLADRGKVDEARKALSQAIDDSRALRAAAKDDQTLAIALAGRLATLGELETQAGQFEAAAKAFAEGLDAVASVQSDDAERARARLRRGQRALPPTP